MSPRTSFIRRVSLRRRLLMLMVMLLWVGLMLYPDPRSLVVSLRRLAHPPVDAAAVRGIADQLPNDAAAIEAFSQAYVPYKYAWTLYGKPWYFPTVDEVLKDRAGDCQAEALLTASIFEAKGMPYTFRYSFDHVWVDYPGKQATKLEDPATAFVSNEGKGWWASLPDRIPLRDVVEERVRFHWEPMPAGRKAGLGLGILLAFLIGERLFIRPIRRPVARATGARERTQTG
jgi:hypothetical protein